MPRNTDTSAALQQSRPNAAARSAADPDRLGRSVRVTAAGLVAGVVTPDDLVHAVQLAVPAPGSADYHLRKLAESAATLTPEQVDRLAAILRPALASTTTVDRGLTIRHTRGRVA